MKTHTLVQGSPEWLAYRAQHFNASDAPAMMGCSAYKTRSQLLHEMHTGLTPDVDAGTQRRFDDGHRFEALARPLAEKIIGEELFPATGSEGKLSASFDGLTMCETTGFEHKSLNAELRALLLDQCLGSELPLQYRVQMEQQCMVSGAERILFMASKWDGETLIEARDCWYTPDTELRAAIIAGWAQFEIDLAAYVPTEAAPVMVAAAVTALPAVAVNVSGQIAVIDNFKAFEVALRDFIDHRLILKPETDQDFADLDLQIKALKGAEAALDAAEMQMLSQVEAVDMAKRTKDMLHKLTRDNRLMAEKLLASRKEQIKGEIVTRGAADLRAHIDGLNVRLGKPYMPAIPADFAGAAKNKRTVDSLRESVNQELTRCKIESNAIADKIQLNLGYLREHAKDYTFLFADAGQIVLKAADDLQTLVKSRIADHQAEVARKEEETRERIRAEEQAKAQREANEKLAREAEEQRLADEVDAAKLIELPIAAPTVTQLTANTVIAAAPTANVVPMRTAAAPVPATPPSTPPTLKLGQIAERLGFTLTAEFLKTLGFEPAAMDKSSKLFHEADFTHICAALVAHIQSVQAKQAA